MKKKVIAAVLILSWLMISIFLTSAYASDNVYYITQHGVKLTETQYENLAKVYTEEELDCLPIPYIDSIKDDSTLRLIASDEVSVVTRTRYNEKGEPVETINEEVTEAEAKRIAAEINAKEKSNEDSE